MQSKWLMKQQEREQQESAIISDIDQMAPATPPAAPDQLYLWQTGDNMWQVARRLGFDASELMEHNGITDPNSLAPGFVLHLPQSRPVDSRPPSTYEVLTAPKAMHLNKDAKKWSFADPKTASDMFETGPTYKAGHNVWIVARANVPLGEDSVRFYMDSLALGNFASTGRVAYTIGYAEDDLSEGHVSAPLIFDTPLPDDQVEVFIQSNTDRRTILLTAGYPEALASDPSVQQQAIVSPDQELRTGAKVRVVKYVEPEQAPVVEPEVEETPNLWKGTYSAFTEPALYYARQTVMVSELDGRRPDRELQNNQPVNVAGIFYKDGVEYARPTGAVKAGYWFGIPTEYIISDEELYDTNIDLESKVAIRAELTLQERIIVGLSKALAQYTKLKSFVSKKKEQ